MVHDADNGYGGFGSLIYNLNPSNQFRFVTSHAQGLLPDSLRSHSPMTSRTNPGNGFTAQYPSIGLRDGDHESDVLLNFSWVHTFNSKLMLTVSPFYHYNSANYDRLAQ